MEVGIFGDFNSFVVADIPGLIEDASKGKGLGTQFLKHIERTKILVFMLDSTTDDLDEQYNKLLIELDSHDKSIKKKKSIILITKSDLTKEECDTSKLPTDIINLYISSITGNNIDESIKYIYQLLEEK